MDVDVDNDLQCPICLELYTYPIILPCSHVLCRTPCAEHLFDFNFIRCPVCRDNCYVSGGISSLPRVIALENIIERYKKEQKKGTSSPRPSSSASTNKPQMSQKGTQISNTSTSSNLTKTLEILNDSVTSLSNLASETKVEIDIKCQNCRNTHRKRAKKHCITCNRNYCAACLRVTHPNKEPFTSHEFMEPGAGKSKSGVCSSKNNESVLPLVTSDPDSYCQLCTQPFCSGSDDVSIHVGHTVTPINDAYRELKVTYSDSYKTKF